jgi:hypothetical protein
MDTKTKHARLARNIRIIAAIVIVLALFGIGYSVWTLYASNAGTSNSSSCSYAISPEESGLTPTIYVDLKHSESMDLTFGELTKFHAECQHGKIRYWVLTIDDFCIRETIELDSSGTWSCIINVDGYEGWSMRMGSLWTYPQGMPENGWIETNPIPLMTPVPVPPEGSVIG